MKTLNNAEYKNVIVLTNNESKQFNFLRLLGYENIYQAPTMCMIVTPTKFFNYQIFNLLNNDPKLTNYIKSRDGIIILIDQMNDQIVFQITNIINKNSNQPILIVFEHGKEYPYTLKHLIKSPLHKYIHIRENIDELDGTQKYVKTNDEKKIIKPIIKLLDTKLLDTKLLDTKLLDTKLLDTKLLDTKLLDTKPIDVKVKEWFNNALKKTNPMRISNTPQSISTDRYTESTIPIKQMANEFEQCTLPLEMWNHYGRLKIVYYSLCKYGFTDTINPNEWLCTNWIKYKTSIGHGNLWHYTLTRFWASIIYKLMQSYKNFNDLYTNNPEIQSGQYFKKFYTDSILFTPYAKTNWVPPNLNQL